MKWFVILMAVAPIVFVVSVALHNGLSAWLGMEEPVFFLIAVLGAPALFVIGLVGSLVELVRHWPSGGAVRG
jgi:hypothetical protein